MPDTDIYVAGILTIKDKPYKSRIPPYATVYFPSLSPTITCYHDPVRILIKKKGNQ